MAWKERGTNVWPAHAPSKDRARLQSHATEFSRIPQRFFGDTFPALLLLRPRDQDITRLPRIINPRTGGGREISEAISRRAGHRVSTTSKKQFRVPRVLQPRIIDPLERENDTRRWQIKKRGGEREQEASRFVRFPFPSIFEKNEHRIKWIYKTRCISGSILNGC